MVIELEQYKAVDEHRMEEIKNCIANELNDEGLDVQRITIDEISIDKYGTIEAKIRRKTS